MKKYLISQGYSFKPDYDDMLNKQFTLSSVSFNTSEQSTFGNVVLDRSEIYSLFLKELEPSDFKTKIENAMQSALAANVNCIDTNISVENVENGYNITIEFMIKG